MDKIKVANNKNSDHYFYLNFISIKTSLFILLFFLILNYMNPNLQAVTMVVCSFYPIIKWMKEKKVDSYIFMVIFLLVGITLVSYLDSSFSSYYYLISELKIVVLFMLPSFFFYILEGKDFRKVLTYFFKSYVIIISITTTYGYIALGVFRYTFFLDHSIYLSVSLVLLMSIYYENLTLIWKVLTLYSVFMLGSSNGLIIYIVIVVLKSRIPILAKIVPAFAGSYFSYWYITVFRNRDIFNGGFWAIDRVIIISSVANYARENFNFFQYLFGFGIGKPLDDFIVLTHVHSDEVRGFVNWFYNTTIEGVYSFSFHNEFLRIFFNFGFVGIIAIFFYLYKHLDKTTFTALVIACLTNTIIYSTVGLFVISLIIAASMLSKVERGEYHE